MIADKKFGKYFHFQLYSLLLLKNCRQKTTQIEKQNLFFGKLFYNAKEIEVDKHIVCERFSIYDTIFKISFSDLVFYNIVSGTIKNISHYPQPFIKINHTNPVERESSSSVLFGLVFYS